jgi:hypothetical protein
MVAVVSCGDDYDRHNLALGLVTSIVEVLGRLAF